MIFIILKMILLVSDKTLYLKNILNVVVDSPTLYVFFLYIHTHIYIYIYMYVCVCIYQFVCMFVCSSH